MMNRWLTATVIGAVTLSGCSGRTTGGSTRVQQERALVAAAMRADGFRGYARLFPRQTGTRDCQVRAGPPGHVFAGSCSTRVDLGDDGSARVIFKQSIQGNHWWLVRVSPGRARLIRDWGAPLVEGIA